MTLGDYPATTVREAADKALETHAAVKNGVDPNLKARRDRREMARLSPCATRPSNSSLSI